MKAISREIEKRDVVISLNPRTSENQIMYKLLEGLKLNPSSQPSKAVTRSKINRLASKAPEFELCAPCNDTSRS